MIFGAPFMPTVLGNALLSFVPDRSVSVLGEDTVAVFVPMYNERDGARTCLESLIAQTHAADEIVVSVNGGLDDTFEVVRATLQRHGYRRVEDRLHPALDAAVAVWLPPGTAADGGRPPGTVVVIDHVQRAGKSDSLNEAVRHGVVRSERIVVSDGDTVFDAEFIARLREHFYRLTTRGRGARRRVVLEDVALQSGNVTSWTQPGAPLTARFISSARRAEYAFGSVLRQGQVTRLGTNALLGRSRLFTVVGCGFALRRDLLPLSSSTRTEDHDLTLAAQDRPDVTTRIEVRRLDEQGFRVRHRGRLVPLGEVIEDETIEFVTGGAARFVGDALMRTSDPPHAGGYLAQVERWHGGAQQNLLERAGRRLRPNVAFAAHSALAENLLGIALLAMLLGSVSLNLGNPSLGIAPAALVLALALDVAASTLLVGLGLHRRHRAAGTPLAPLRAALESAGSVLPYTVLRYLSPLVYVAAAAEVVPRHLRRGRALALHAGSWERPSSRTRSPSHVLVPGGIVASLLGMVSLTHFAPALSPVNAEAWRLTHQAERVLLDAHVSLSLRSERPPQQPPDHALGPGPSPDPHALVLLDDDLDPIRSRFCDPAFTLERQRGHEVRLGSGGDAERYTPLSGWELIALLRLVPLIGVFDAATTAYGVPAHLYLRVLLNESYLDPLAVGATDDHGLSQQNGDSLTMLRALSSDPRDPLHNPRLFAGAFSLYDPDFSLCAGAAKLAWALRQPAALGDEHAYALYINPIDGVRGRTVSERHQPLTAPMMELGVLVDRLESAIAAFERQPARLARRDHDAMRILSSVRSGSITLETGYELAFEQVVRFGLPDRDHYRRVFADLLEGRTVGER